jgi:serine/threonine-protein kinase RsbT
MVKIPSDNLRPNFPAYGEIPFEYLQALFYDVSDGRVRLLEAPEDFPERLPFHADAKLVCEENLIWLRRAVSSTASLLCFPQERIDAIVLAVGEAAMNAVTYGGGGSMEVSWDQSGRMAVTIQDVGPGIPHADLVRVLFCKGYSTSGHLGQGLAIIRESIDRLWIYTGCTGTQVVLEMSHEREPDYGWTAQISGELCILQSL